MFHFMKKLGRKGFTMAEMLTVVALISTLAAAARAQAVAAGPEVAGAVDAHMAAAAGSDEEDWGQYYRALDDSSAPAADPDAPAGTSDDAAEWRDYYRQLNPDAPARDANPDPDAPDPNAPAGVPASAGQDDATPDGGFPDADDTGLVSNGLKILVYPSGAGKVTYSDGKYTAVPNEGYGFMAWYYEPRDYSKKSVVKVLQWLRQNEDTAAANRAPLDDGSIQEREGYKYLIAIFERGFTPAIAQPDPSTPAHTHSWGPTTYEWSKNYKKCTAMSTCQTCGAVDKVKADKVTKTEKAATCTKAGKTTYKAVFKKKKLKYKTVEIPALGHDWGDWEVTTAPTCTQAGEEMRTCQRKGCGATENRDVPATGEHIPAAPVRENETAATCQAAGSYESVVYCATCKAELIREKKTTEKLTTHTPGDAVVENEVKATCKAGGSYDSVVYCTVCQAELSREKKTTEKLTTHTPGDAVVENEVKATCKAGGSYDSVVYCTVCQAELSRETIQTEKLAHTEVAIPAVPATCTESGKTAGVKCSVCDTILTPQQDTEPLGHTGGEATCKAKAVCTRCKQPYGDYGPHQYELVEPGHAADCENPGSTALYRCSVCDEAEIGGDIIELLGHEYKDGLCKRCGKKEPGIVEEEEPMTEP